VNTYEDNGGVAPSGLFLRATPFHELVSLQCILPREGLAASSITKERLFAGMSLPMPFEVMLTIERECAHITGKRALGGSRILHLIDTLNHHLTVW
jgi:hypothetical protein